MTSRTTSFALVAMTAVSYDVRRPEYPQASGSAPDRADMPMRGSPELTDLVKAWEGSFRSGLSGLRDGPLQSRRLRTPRRTERPWEAAHRGESRRSVRRRVPP